MRQQRTLRIGAVVVAALVFTLAPGAFAQFDVNGNWTVSGKIGVGTTNPQGNGLEIRQSANPSFVLQETGGNTFSTFFNDGTNARLINRAFSGGSIFFFDTLVDNGSSPVSIRFFRSTNTSGTRRIDFFVGNGSSTIASRIDTGGGNSWFNASGGNVGIGVTNPAQKLDVAGTARVEILEITGGADLSEQFNVSAAGDIEPQPGMVVSIDTARPGELVVSNKPYDRTVAGIVSGAGGLKTGMMMGQIGSAADGQHAVALTGRVYCRVDASFGAVQPGDLLTTSPTKGHAMKVTDHAKAVGAILGKAMTPLAEGEKGLVLVLVSLQ